MYPELEVMMRNFKNVSGRRKGWLQGWGFDSARREKRAIESAFRQTARADIEEQILDELGPDPETIRQATVAALLQEMQDLEFERTDLVESLDWWLDRGDDDQARHFYDFLIRKVEARIGEVEFELARLSQIDELAA